MTAAAPQQTPPKPEPEGRLRRAARSVTRRLDLHKTIATVGTLVAIAAAFGLISSRDGGSTPDGPVRIPSADVAASASGPVLARQDDDEDANDYGPDNMLDGSRRTAWVEGEKNGLGVGERLTFRFPRRVDLARIEIVNGYAKSTRRHLDNGAVKTVLVRADGLERPLRRTLSRDSRRQAITARFGETREVELEVLSVYRGDVHADTAISEVTFYANR